MKNRTRKLVTIVTIARVPGAACAFFVLFLRLSAAVCCRARFLLLISIRWTRRWCVRLQRELINLDSMNIHKFRSILQSFFLKSHDFNFVRNLGVRFFVWLITLQIYGFEWVFAFLMMQKRDLHVNAFNGKKNLQIMQPPVNARDSLFSASNESTSVGIASQRKLNCLR